MKFSSLPMRYRFTTKILTFSIGIGIICSCSIMGDPYYVKRSPKHLIINSDKKTKKDNIKSHKIHNKAIEQKKEELATYLPTESKKKTRRKKGYN